MTPTKFNAIIKAARSLATAHVRRSAYRQGNGYGNETRDNTENRVKNCERKLGDQFVGLYSLDELEALKEEYLLTLNEDKGDWALSPRRVHEIGLDGFFTWLKYKEKSQK